jgi:hypothetical protein
MTVEPWIISVNLQNSDDELQVSFKDSYRLHIDSRATITYDALKYNLACFFFVFDVIVKNMPKFP